jgi:hypothetical protein
MGQQLNKIIKRRRRKLYLARKKALAKSGQSLRKTPAAKPTAKPAAKKPAAKKPAAKKVAKASPAAETPEAVVEAQAPAAEA